MVVRLTGDELAQIHRIATSQDREISRIVRGWIAAAYREQWGSEAPPAPKLRHAPAKK